MTCCNVQFCPTMNSTRSTMSISAFCSCNVSLWNLCDCLLQLMLMQLVFMHGTCAWTDAEGKPCRKLWMNCELLSAFCFCFVFALIVTTIKSFTIVSKHTNGHIAKHCTWCPNNSYILYMDALCSGSTNMLYSLLPCAHCHDRLTKGSGMLAILYTCGNQRALQFYVILHDWMQCENFKC